MAASEEVLSQILRHLEQLTTSNQAIQTKLDSLGNDVNRALREISDLRNSGLYSQTTQSTTPSLPSNFPVPPFNPPSLPHLPPITNTTSGGDDEGIDQEGSAISYIENKPRRYTTFSKRKAVLMLKAYEISVLTGTQNLILIVSDTGLVYTYSTPKLQPIVTQPEGKNLIQSLLNAPANITPGGVTTPNDVPSPPPPPPPVAEPSEPPQSTTDGDIQEDNAGKLPLERIKDDRIRNLTFSARKAAILKLAYELSTITGTQVLAVCISEAGLASSFATARLQPLLSEPEGRDLFDKCLKDPENETET